MTFRLGLIARCETARGLAIQSRNFYDHMPVDKVLLVRMPRPDGPESPEWYQNRTDVAYNPANHSLDEPTVREWLDGLDVVFCVETPHDWRAPTWCKEQGVKLVVQGNPEFIRHMRPEETIAHPDQWWWPTSWRLDQLPAGVVMPVPMDPHPVTRSDDERLHILHVIGKRAYADRNGTELLVQAMRMVTEEVKLTVHSIDGGVAEFSHNRYVEKNLQLDPVDDLWTMYEDQDILVLPRRYGGLSLPAIEASAAGLVVMMPDCSPNAELAAMLVPCHTRTKLSLACGPVATWDAKPAELAAAIGQMAAWRKGRVFGELRRRQGDLLATWDVWRSRYLAALEAA